MKSILNSGRVLAGVSAIILTIPASLSAADEAKPRLDPSPTAHISDDGKPNTLTRKEIKDGWILLFDGQTDFGWDTKGQVAVVDRAIRLGGNDKPGSIRSTTVFGDFILRFSYRATGSAPILLIGGEPILLPSTDNWVEAELRRSRSEGELQIQSDKAKPINFEGSFAAPIKFGAVESSDRGGAGTKSARGVATLDLRNIKLKPLGLESVFNGKDLTGWKEVPGHKSRYTVIDGAINVKDGSGELQTERKWKDFVLQIEVISNGTHLNSGVFFRCLPGEFWQGYESQVRNQWEGDDRTKPVDFGTGGVYNLQPARKVLSTDGEWFTKTVVAHGPHIATWINGFQTADVIDKRDPAPTARKGLYLDAGCISLQGHDPTTDLSFRNIRVAELPSHR